MKKVKASIKKIKPNSKTKFGNTHISMMRSVVAFVFASANIAITQSIQAWFDLMSIIKSNLESADSIQKIITQKITGYAAQKAAAKQALVQMSAAIMRSVYSYAVQQNDQILANAMYTSRSGLSRLEYNDLVNTTQGVIDTVNPLVPLLTDYNITPALMQQWQDSNTLLRDILASPNKAVSHRKTLNEDFHQLMITSMNLLINQADGMALNFSNNPATVNYYNEYRANRKLKPSGHVPTQLRAHVMDELNQPIQGATVTVAGITGTTDEKGYCHISPVSFGSHKVAVINGPNSYSFGPYDFKKGQSLTLDFVIAPSFAMPNTTAAPKTAKA